MTDQVFMCYAREDEDFVLKLAGALKAQGVPVWIDQWELPVGADWDMEIEEALSKSSHLVLVISPASMRSREVRDEWRAVIDEGIQIIPVLLEECRIHRRLKQREYVDFTSTSPTDATAVGEIVRALGMEGRAAEKQERPPALSAEPDRAQTTGELRSPGTGPISLDLVRVPAGEFSMGSDRKRAQYAQDDEFPQHQLNLPEFHIGRYPVTNEQYQAFIQATGYRQPRDWKARRMPLGKENHPVVAVKWIDAVAFCTWLSEETGQTFRLPTEAEWEKAARGTDGRIWPWGDEPPDGSRCNFGNQVRGTTPVGRYSPQGDSPYGCADMAGNVDEWCQSLHRPYPYQAGDGREDLKADGWRVLRGGSFDVALKDVRCASRNSIIPDIRDYYYGFRVAMGTLPGAP